MVSDLQSDMAAELRAKVVYQYLFRLIDDRGVRETIDFLLNREEAIKHFSARRSSGCGIPAPKGNSAAPTTHVTTSTCPSRGSILVRQTSPPTVARRSRSHRSGRDTPSTKARWSVRGCQRRKKARQPLNRVRNQFHGGRVGSDRDFTEPAS